MEEEPIVEVPSYFLCPISLQIMSDPVTLRTGITYDRESIERWIFSGAKNKTCPVSNQPLTNLDLTPNLNLRRLIQAWCSENASAAGIQLFPNPRPPVGESQIIGILDEAKIPETQASALQKLKAIVSASDRNKHYAESLGAVKILVSIIEKKVCDQEEEDRTDANNNACDEALSILCSLQLSENGLIHLVQSSSDVFKLLEKLISSQQNFKSRACALQLIKSLLPVISQTRLSGLKEDFYQGILKMIQDRISQHATKTALQVLAGIGPSNRNWVHKAVKAGAVPIMVELLIEEPDKRTCEIILTVLERLCRCAEGRADLVGHAAGIAAVSKKILRVSSVASGMALKILYAVAKLSASPAVLQEMMEVGAVTKLFYLLQMDTGMKIMEKTREILKLHCQVWRNSPCLTPLMKATYPL